MINLTNNKSINITEVNQSIKVIRNVGQTYSKLADTLGEHSKSMSSAMELITKILKENQFKVVNKM